MIVLEIPDSRYQSLMQLRPDATTERPSGVKAVSLSLDENFSNWNRRVGVGRDQMLTVPSVDADASRSSSGAKATDRTMPLTIVPRALPSGKNQRRTVPSWAPDAKVIPSGDTTDAML